MSLTDSSGYKYLMSIPSRLYELPFLGMTPRYAVRTIILATGERLPVLMDITSGEPLFEPTVYSVSKLRSGNLASNSIEAALRAVMVLYVFLELRHIDLNERLRKGEVLGLGEIEELVRLCRLPMKQL